MSSLARPTDERRQATGEGEARLEPALQDAEVPAAPVESASRLAVISGRIHFAALLLVVASSPFEAGYRPVGRFLWAIFTNLEAALFILAITWLFKLAVDPAARVRLLRLPLLLPFFALVGAAIISGFFGEYKAMVVQVIYRLVVGMVVYASAYEALRERGRLVIALGTVVAAGTLSAALGLLEFAPGIDIQPWLKAFKPAPTTVGGEVRLSGTFEYANGAAMYFEMALPVLVSLAVLFSSRRLVAMLSDGGRVSEVRRLGLLGLLVLSALIYTMALILTYSRAALVGLVAALGVIGGVTLFRRGADSKWIRPTAWMSLGLTFIVMVASFLFVFATQPMFRLRLTTENDRDWYGATVVAAPLPALSAQEVLTVPITIKNYGQMTWSASGVLPIDVSYHWLSATDDVYLVFDGLRTPLPHDVSPGETVSVNAIVQAPPQPGDYRLQWDLVHEHVTWFEGKQGMTAQERTYHVGERATLGNTQAPEVAMPPPVAQILNTDFASVGREQLWKVALDMFFAHPLTGVGPDGFRNLYGEYAGVTEWNRNIYTNNTYLEMFTNLGLLGGLAFLWLAGLALWRSVRNLFRKPISPVWIVGLGATAAIVAFFVHGFVDYFLFATPMYVAFWFLTSVAVNWPNSEKYEF